MAVPKNDKIYTAIVLDFETGGVDSTKHGVTQVGMQAIRLDTFEVFASYKEYVTPYHKVELEKKKVVRKKKDVAAEEESGPPLMEYDWAMCKRVTGITEEICEEKGLPLEQVVANMSEFCKKAHLSKSKDTLPIIVGQNIGFDIGFLEQMYAFTKQKIKGLVSGNDGFRGFTINTLDTINLARLMYANDPQVTSYKLGLIAEKLGVDLFDAHDAMADVEATGDIVRVLAQKMRAVGGTLEGETQKVKKRDHWGF